MMAELAMRVRVVTPETPVFEGAAEAVVAPAHDGEVGILPRHARFLARLGLGELRITAGGAVQRFFLEGGFVQVRGKLVTILCERAAPLESLDVSAAAAEAERARAEKAAGAADLAQRASVMRRVMRRSSA
jgi:F-type H+-transporting ATPase subunit epsilon